MFSSLCRRRRSSCWISHIAYPWHRKCIYCRFSVATCRQNSNSWQQARKCPGTARWGTTNQVSSTEQGEKIKGEERGRIFSDITRKFAHFTLIKNARAKEIGFLRRDRFDIAFHISNRITSLGTYCSVIIFLPLPLPLSLSAYLWYEMWAFSCRVLTVCLNNAYDNMNIFSILFLSEKLQWHKRGKADGTKDAAAPNDDTAKVEQKVFHQCLRCEFISHADVLDRKPLPGACSSSCRYCLPGRARHPHVLRTVATRQRAAANCKWGFN